MDMGEWHLWALLFPKETHRYRLEKTIFPDMEAGEIFIARFKQFPADCIAGRGF
jgi:hypothetical protein